MLHRFKFSLLYLRDAEISRGTPLNYVIAHVGQEVWDLFVVGYEDGYTPPAMEVYGVKLKLDPKMPPHLIEISRIDCWRPSDLDRRRAYISDLDPRPDTFIGHDRQKADDSSLTTMLSYFAEYYDVELRLERHFKQTVISLRRGPYKKDVYMPLSVDLRDIKDVADQLHKFITEYRLVDPVKEQMKRGLIKQIDLSVLPVMMPGDKLTIKQDFTMS